MRLEENINLDTVRLIDPTLCTSCRFASVALLEREDSSVVQLVRCKRLDCDNWQFEEAPAGIDLSKLHLLD